MRVFAYCSAEYETWVRLAAGVQPVLSPPVNSNTLDLTRLEGKDLLYFKLYGEPGAPWWLNKRGEVALTDDKLRHVDLSGAVVFVGNCYLPESPMLQALLDAGAEAVIGGDGLNYFRKSRMDGVDLLGQRFREWLQSGLSASTSLKLAKLSLRLSSIGIGKVDKVVSDTLDFKLWRNEHVSVSKLR